ncbi:MAG: hypothetical protein A2W90_18115 [Bacteroidetes bacterium GWF2_42_66]|nr:MAG: hypothetical protein A2W92_06105 [Bacteroidetes bacterium GWA2_42_15]OFX98168.1 MAG: hypothetical protein A2W89_09605 [Bacteroidetes bacterium GWE2_42_39]OFY42553.1 MAG: hypothetical protein A2W90_18115 [Bacteroidetes bacterium GWF2_42_66]HBL74269.1 hypothetical protein [Prolixibacteraceae bacterium]HCU64038.1 hypothetical protein [Prolixibacteraceae bacterium]
MDNRFKYINSRKLTGLADKIACLEDEFKISLLLKQKDRAALIEIALGEHYASLMREVRKNGLKSIEITRNQVKATFNR